MFVPRKLRTTFLVSFFGTMAVATAIACGGSDAASVSEGTTAGDQADAGPSVTTPPPSPDASGMSANQDPPSDGQNEEDDAAAPAQDADGGAPSDGGPSDAAATADGGFDQACTSNAQCTSAFPVCFNFTLKGRHCTKKCKKSSDCPAGSTCNSQKVCKIP